jgi:hypothetical protein
VNVKLGVNKLRFMVRMCRSMARKSPTEMEVFMGNKQFAIENGH